MKSSTSLLARLFGRSQSPIVTALYANVIGQPLCVHPQIGEQLLGGYLQGAVDARPPTLQIGEIAPSMTDPVTGVVTEARNVAILNVSGGLVNRFEPGMCDPGPLSYESLRRAFDAALADSTVEAIVMRIESPGGMASGLFDLADHVHANRGAKPIYAAVDDYAYSAAYGLAAAADEIWVTRTGGVGSVGVIAYHVDQSGYDSKIGVKVTTVFSGDHKADMSPHEPLSKGTKAWLQSRMDSMRELFAQSVATYRGLELDAVLATEAQVYQGQAGIDVGFADRLGTFGELMSHIAAGEDDEEDDEESAAESAAPEVSAAAAMSDEQLAALDRAAIADAVLAADLPPALTAALQRSTVTPADVDARIAAAQQIANLCTAARLPDAAADYVQRGTDVETVRAQLQATVASVGPEIVTAIPHNPEGVASKPTRAEGIYSRRSAAAAGNGSNPRQ